MYLAGLSLPLLHELAGFMSLSRVYASVGALLHDEALGDSIKDHDFGHIASLLLALVFLAIK